MSEAEFAKDYRHSAMLIHNHVTGTRIVRHGPVQGTKQEVVGMVETEHNPDSQTTKTLWDRAKTVGTIVAVAVPIVATSATVVLQFHTIGMQDELQDQQHDLSKQQHELSRQVTVSDRYNQAALHLGSDDPIERIAGIYGLRDLVSDDKKMGPRALRLLASYLVFNTDAMTSNERGVASGILTDLSRDFDITDASSLSYDLANVTLSGNYLYGLRSHGGYFVGLDVSNANLSNAQFVCTNIVGAKLIGTDLSGEAKLDKILVDGRTDFSGVKGANLETFGDLYWDEAPILPLEFQKARAGTVSDFQQVC